MKTFPCIIVKNFHSFESDTWSLISSTGAQISFWAHDATLSPETPDQALLLVRSIFARWNEAPVEGEYVGPLWQRGKTLELTREEMLAFKTICERVEEHARSIRSSAGAARAWAGKTHRRFNRSFRR